MTTGKRQAWLDSFDEGVCQTCGTSAVNFAKMYEDFNTQKHDDYYREFRYPIYKAYVKDLLFVSRDSKSMQMEIGGPEDTVEVILKIPEKSNIEKIFNNLESVSWAGIDGTVTVYEAYVDGNNFEIGVWHDPATKRFLVKMYNAYMPLEQNEMKEMLYKLRDEEQEFSPVTKNDSTYPNSVFTMCRLSAREGLLSALSTAEINKIPDSPSLSASGISEHKNWSNQDDEPYTRYAAKETITECHSTDPVRDRLAVIIKNDDIIYMAFNFVRTVVVPYVEKARKKN